MRTFVAEIKTSFNAKYTFNVAAQTFMSAIPKVRAAARRNGFKKIRFVSLVQTAKLDA